MQKLFEFDEHIGAWRVLVQTRDIQSGAVSTRCLADEAVTEDKLADGSVTGVKIGTGAVTEDKIADGAIDSIHIKSNTVSGEKLADEAIESRHIKDNSIGAEKIKDGTIENVDIKDGTLDGSKIKDGTIDGTKMADNAIESRHLIDNSIPGSKIKDGTIENVDIKDGTLDGSKIKDNTIQGGKLADGAISNSKIVDGSVTESKIGTGAVTESKIGTGAVTESKIGTGAVTENKISDGAVTENKLAPGAVTTDKLSDGVISELQTITDAVPTASSVKPVQSGGTLDSIIKHGSAFDLSAYNSGTTYADLTAALTALNSLPSTFKKGGMSFKYVQTSDNNYIRYNLLADSFTTDVTRWAIDNVGVYVENPEYINIKTDKDGRILWAIKTDGSIYWGAGVPQQVIDYVTNKISELSLDEYEDIVTFLGNLIEGDTLATLLNGKVDKVTGKSLIDADFASSQKAVENPEWIDIKTDSEGKILEGIRSNGKKYIADLEENLSKTSIYDLYIASKDSKWASKADVVCTGNRDEDTINEALSRTGVKTVYFYSDSEFILSAPILPQSGQSLISNGAYFTVIDCVTVVLAEDKTNTLVEDSLKLVDASELKQGMMLYIADNAGNMNNLLIKSVNYDNNIINFKSLDNGGRAGQTWLTSNNVVIKTASPAIFIDRKSNVVIDGLFIDLNVANNPFLPKNPWHLQEAVSMFASNNITLKNSKMINGGRRGTCPINCTYFYILNNYFNNWWEHSIDIFSDYVGDTTNPMMNYGVISGNICINNKMSGIQFHRGSGCSCTGNVIKHCERHSGINVSEFGRHISITGNMIEDCNFGCHLCGHDITFTGNVIKDSQDVGINIGGGSDRINVTGNEVYNSKTNGIRLSQARHCKVSDNLVVNSCMILEEWQHYGSDINMALVYMNNISSEYFGENKCNVVTNNTFVEYERDYFPKYIFYDSEVGKKNVFMNNISIIEKSMDNPYVYDAISDTVKQNEIIN